MDELLDEIARRARRQRSELLREAEERAEEIRDRARKRAEELRARRLEDTRAEVRGELDAQRAREEQESRGQVLEARAELLERVRTRARELLDEAMRSDAYRSRLGETVREARTCLPSDREVLFRCPPALEKELREHLEDAGNGARVESDPEIAAGFLVGSPDGGVTVDATLARRLERDWEELARGVLADVEERWVATGDR